MARVTFVKSATQRYATVPVIDPETGEPQIRTLHKKDGTPKTNRRGEPVTQRVTRADRSQPLPNRKCGRCGAEIQVGEGYYWWANKLPGSRSGYKQIRCSEHPPTLAERTPGRAGQWMQMEEGFGKQIADTDSYTEDGEFSGLAQDIASEIRSFGEEFTESAENMESGFGHETEQSTELRERGDRIIEAADEIEGMDFDPSPEKGDEDEDETDEQFEERLESWRDECRTKLEDEISNVDIY
jgi:hypothetical protein